MRGTMLGCVLLLAGCPAAVTAEGMDDGFGLGMSAVWMHVDAGQEESDSVVLANYGDVCLKTQNLYDALDELDNYADEILSDDYCEEIEESFLAYVDAASALQFEGANVVTLSVEGDLDDDEYEFDDDAYGWVAHVDENPWEDVADDFDTDGTAGDGCGVGTLDDDYGDNWSLTDGSVEITALAEEASASGTVDARMKESGGDKSDFTASFSAAYCEIDL